MGMDYIGPRLSKTLHAAREPRPTRQRFGVRRPSAAFSPFVHLCFIRVRLICDQKFPPENSCLLLVAGGRYIVPYLQCDNRLEPGCVGRLEAEP